MKTKVFATEAMRNVSKTKVFAAATMRTASKTKVFAAATMRNVSKTKVFAAEAMRNVSKTKVFAIAAMRAASISIFPTTMQKISAICSAACFMICSCADNARENVECHSKRAIILWMPTYAEYEKHIAQYPSEEKYAVEDSDMNSTAAAMAYILGKNEKPAIDTAKAIGFAFRQDTVILRKGEEQKIILFDGKTEPIAASPADIADGKYAWFFEDGSAQAQAPITYHSEKIAIIWRPTAKEKSEALAGHSEEERKALEEDNARYIENAKAYIASKGERIEEDSAKAIGFAYQGGSSILAKKDAYKEGKGFWWRIILFDGKTKPAVISPIEASLGKASWFFQNPAEPSM